MVHAACRTLTLRIAVHVARTVSIVPTRESERHVHPDGLGAALLAVRVASAGLVLVEGLEPPLG